jgi:hypothetical protein
MAKKRRAHDEEAWRNAKKICRLNARHVEMARALGMNPNKLPHLRQSPQQHWKLPVGEFIEQRYWKRFGGPPLEEHTNLRQPATRRPSTLYGGPPAPERIVDTSSQAADLVCYLMNLADDLQQWLSQGTVDPDVLPQVSEELRGIAKALDAQAPILPIPESPLPPRQTRPAFSRRRDRQRTDDEIPF